MHRKWELQMRKTHCSKRREKLASSWICKIYKKSYGKSKIPKIRLTSFVHGPIYKSPYFCRLEDQIDTSERLFDTYPILIYPCRIYDHGPSNRDNR